MNCNCIKVLEQRETVASTKEWGAGEGSVDGGQREQCPSVRDAELLNLREDSTVPRWFQLPSMISARRAFGAVLAPASARHSGGASNSGSGIGPSASKQHCKFFAGGSCRFGSRCKYQHGAGATATTLPTTTRRGAETKVTRAPISQREAARRRAAASSFERRASGRDLEAAAQAAAM